MSLLSFSAHDFAYRLHPGPTTDHSVLWPRATLWKCAILHTTLKYSDRHTPFIATTWSLSASNLLRRSSAAHATRTRKPNRSKLWSYKAPFRFIPTQPEWYGFER